MKGEEVQGCRRREGEERMRPTYQPGERDAAKMKVVTSEVREQSVKMMSQ